MSAILQNSSLRKDLVFFAPLDEWNGSRDMISGTVGTPTAVYPVLDKKGSGRRWLEPLTASPYSSHTAIAAFGTGNFTIIRKVKTGTIGTAQSLTGGAANAFDFYISATGYLTGIKFGGSALTASTTLLTANTEYVLSYIRSGTTTGTYYVNGVSAGTCTDANDYTVGCTLRCSGTGYFLGNDYMSRAFNFALTPTVQLINYSKPEYPIEKIHRGVADLITGWNLTNWTIGANGTINDLNTFTTTASDGVYKNIGLTPGRSYRLQFSGITTASNLAFRDAGGASQLYIDLGTGTINVSSTFSVTLDNSAFAYFKHTGAGQTDITSMSIWQLGCVLDLNAEGMSSATWIDNTTSLTATNSGTFFNLPAASNMGASFLNGSTSGLVYTGVTPILAGADRTFFARINLNRLKEQQILSFGASGCQFFINSSNKLGIAEGTNPSGYSNTTFVANTWYNVVATYRSGIITYWINGLQENSASITLNTTAGNTYIGSYLTSGSYRFEGIMKDVAIWLRILTADEIAFLNAT